MEERLFALAQLKRKLHRTLPEILALREEIAENLSFLDVCALDITRLGKEAASLAAELAAVIARLAPERRKAAASIAAGLETELRQLGFSEQVRVIPDFAEQEIWPGVMDERGRILWAPNPGQPPQPLDKIASGGELSRFLLALASVQQEDEGATFIFDEVDAGVGGMADSDCPSLPNSSLRWTCSACPRSPAATVPAKSTQVRKATRMGLTTNSMAMQAAMIPIAPKMLLALVIASVALFISPSLTTAPITHSAVLSLLNVMTLRCPSNR